MMVARRTGLVKPARHRLMLRWTVAIALAALIALPGSNFVDAAAALTPDLPSTQPVGTAITWTAMPDAGSGIYQFSVQQDSGPFLVVRDFSPASSFVWTPIEEGAYKVRVKIKPAWGTDANAEVIVPYEITTRVSGNTAVITPTEHPLVALYSAPPCESGNARIEFRVMSEPFWQATNWKPCQEGKSANVYVAGMRAETTYEMRHVRISGPTTEASPPTQFTTGKPTRSFPSFNVVDPIDARTSLADDVIFNSTLSVFRPQLTFPVATDRFGRVIWYYDKLLWTENKSFAYATQIINGGTALILASCCERNGNLLYEIDLAGNTVRQTNLTRVNEQLAARGQDIIRGFHHDAVRFPNGHTLVLGMIQRTVPQGELPAFPTMGDMVIALDQNLQVAWTWNAFEKLDVDRAAVLRENCLVAYGSACPASTVLARDWLHSNKISYSPSDGNLIISMRHQDWIVKVDYRNGTGTGDVLWRLGRGGDFKVEPADPSNWFSHQHDAVYVGPNQIAVFDNGNTRCAPTGPILPGCHSRGQVLELNENLRTATLQLNADLGGYSERQGSAQKLTNGNFFFLSGYELPGRPSARAVEVGPNGSPNFVLRVDDSTYRAYAMKSLYVP
jgi:hypothetical protein